MNCNSWRINKHILFYSILFYFFCRLMVLLRQVTAPCPAWREMLRQELELVDTPDLPLVDLTGVPSAFRCVPSQQPLLSRVADPVPYRSALVLEARSGCALKSKFKSFEAHPERRKGKRELRKVDILTAKGWRGMSE